MDDDIIEYCVKAISFINNDENNYELIIALILRELKENDIVYINLNKKWYQYNKKNKEWKEYNFKIVLSKITELYEFFDEIIIDYLDRNEKLNANNKKKFKRICKNISTYIYNNKIDKEKLLNTCCNVFSIHNDI